MNLHICTISSRDEYLQSIYNSLPKDNDIVWHICRGGDKFVGLTSSLYTDYRVKVYHIDCEDTDTATKMQYIFDRIIATDSDSYFCILDDDTHFHIGMYLTYQEYKEREGKWMVIGSQQDKNGTRRLQGTLPYECAIDSGNVLCHSHCLVPEKWPTKHWDESYHIDFDFWNRCYKHFGLKRTDIIQQNISIYNAYSNKPDTLDYVR